MEDNKLDLVASAAAAAEVARRWMEEPAANALDTAHRALNIKK